MSVEPTSPRASKTSYLALTVAVVIAAVALVSVAVVHHAHVRHVAAVARHDRAAAYAAARRVELPSTFAPTHQFGTAPCGSPGSGRLAERCWFTPVEPHQVTGALLAAARKAGLPGALRGCSQTPTKQDATPSTATPVETCSIVARYGPYLVRLTATTNLATGTPNLTGQTATDATTHADGTDVIVMVVSD